MSSKQTKKVIGIEKRKRRTRSKIFGTSQKPRLSVFRSNKNIYAQMIDDEKKLTVCSASDIKLKGTNKTDNAVKVGEQIAKLSKEKKIKKCVFDRGGYIYHGRVKALADSARKGGLEF